MKWKVEYITDDSSNILIDDPSLSDIDKEPVGLGFPVKLAESLVKKHNDSLEPLRHAVANAVVILNNAVQSTEDYLGNGFKDDAQLYIKNTKDFFTKYMMEQK